MTKSVWMAIVPLTNSQSKTLCPFEVISAKPETVTVDANGINHTVFMESLTLEPCNPQGNDGTEQDSDMKSASICRNEDRTDKNDAEII